MNKRAIRLRLLGISLATITLGVASRRIHLGSSLWDKSLGDVLYAALIYFALVMLVPRAATWTVAAFALLACFAIELFQLTGIPVVLAERAPWVHWILGSTFAWHDVACYAIGVSVAVATRQALARSRS